MKNLIFGLFILATFAPTTFAAKPSESLDVRAARECKQFAVNHALKKEKASWGAEVSVLHLDRSIPTGLLMGAVGEDEGYVNVEVTLSRESADPIVYEMSVTAKVNKKTKALTCKVTKEATRELL